MKFYFLGNFLAYFDFWIAISIPFMTYQGIPIEQTVTLLSIYALSTTILEFPTGVVGDYFGHKVSVVTGLLFDSVSFFLLLFATNFWIFLVALIFRSIGMSLKSGSDEAMLKSLATDFKSSYSKVSSLQDLSLFGASVIGGLIASISFEIAIFVNVVTYALATLIMSLVPIKPKIKSEKQSANIFALSWTGLKVSFTNKHLLSAMVFLMFFYGYGRNVKSIFGIAGDIFTLDVAIVGILVGVGMLVRSFGKYAARYVKAKYYNHFVILFLVVLGMTSLVNNSYLFLLTILISNSLLGLVLTLYRVKLMNLIPSQVRASVFSFSGMLTTLASSAHLFLFGSIVAVYSIQMAMLFTLVSLCLVFCSIQIIKLLDHKRLVKTV